MSGDVWNQYVDIEVEVPPLEQTLVRIWLVNKVIFEYKSFHLKHQLP